MEEQQVVLTYRALIFGGGFWQKLVHSPCNNDKHSYWIHRLNKKMESAQKKVGPEFKKFCSELGEKYGLKTPEGKVAPSGNQLPQANPDQRDEYDEMLDGFMQKTIDLDFTKKPLEFFAHIGKTPMDWDALEQIAYVDEDAFEKKDEAAKPNIHSIANHAH